MVCDRETASIPDFVRDPSSLDFIRRQIPQTTANTDSTNGRIVMTIAVGIQDAKPSNQAELLKKIKLLKIRGLAHLPSQPIPAGRYLVHNHMTP
jgi:hypothetical protein